MPRLPDHDAKPVDHLIQMGKGDAPALVLRDGTLNYDALRDRVGKLAAWLQSVVPKKGARVASWAAKGELTCMMPLAAPRAGLVHVPINPLLKRAQVAHILRDSAASLLIGTKARISSLESSDVADDCAVFEEHDAIVAADRMLSGLQPSCSDTDDLAAILYTSGSTGHPKGVMLSHANLWLGAKSVAQYLEMQADDVVLAVLPLSFDYGQNQLLNAWYAGSSAVPLDYLFPRDVAKACATHQITTLAGVPPLWVQLTELDWPGDATSSLRRLTNSGGALTEPLVRDLRAMFPNARLFPMYGLTEAFRSTYLAPDLVDSHPTSMGTAIPFAEVLVVDDNGNVANTDEEGELVHCGPLVAQGYWKDNVRTAKRFKSAPAMSQYGGVAVWSGDRVRRDRHGLLHFIGRRDGMIKSAGNRISPQEVEDAARATGLVSEVVALGVPDPGLGQSVHIVVRQVTGAQGAKALLPKLLAKELPNFMQPQAIHWRDTMPLNANGKLDRAALMAEIAL